MGESKKMLTLLRISPESGEAQHTKDLGLLNILATFFLKDLKYITAGSSSSDFVLPGVPFLLLLAHMYNDNTHTYI